MPLEVAQDPYIWFVYDRFEELRELLESRGWNVVERSDLSEWDEGRRQDPVMGVVRIRGHRDWALGGHVSFTVKEWWARPPVDGVLERQGFVLAGYHYTAQSATGQRRHCFDPARHSDAPAHVHPDGGPDLYREEPIDVADALDELEQRLAEQLYMEVGSAFNGEEDDIDEVFGESDQD